VPTRPRLNGGSDEGGTGYYEDPEWWEDTTTDTTTVPAEIDTGRVAVPRGTGTPSDWPTGHPDSGGDEGTPGDDTYPDPGGGDGGGGGGWTTPWGEAPAGMEAWWNAGEPRNLTFDWESGLGGNWFPDPGAYGGHLDTLRSTGEGARTWADMNRGPIPSSAYGWKDTGRDTGSAEFPNIENYGDWYNLQQRYGAEMGFDEHPWGPGQALQQGENKTQWEDDYNARVQGFNSAAEQAYSEWQNRPPPPPSGEAACLAKGDGSTWDGTNCIPPKPPVPPDTREADCIAAGDTWTNGVCIPRAKTVVNGENGNGETVASGDHTATDISTDIDIPYTGEIDEDVETTDYPLTTPQMQTIGNIGVGDDPISEIANATLATTMLSGGVPNTPFNEGTMDAIAQIIGAGGAGGAAETPFGEGVQSEIQNLIDNQGYLEADPQRRAMEFEQLRSPIDAMRRAQMAQGQQAMAGRNILGSGAEVDFLERLEGSLAPAYASAGQQLALNTQQAADDRYMDALASGQDLATAQADRREARLLPALSLAAGITEASARNMLDAAASWTDRQAMLSDVVMRNLDQNMDWSKFVANFGLNRDQVMHMMTTGQMDALVNALNNNYKGLQAISQGFVPYGDVEGGIL
jgi:hypothetical protein